MTYQEQLRQPEWLTKRQIIIDQAEGMCAYCYTRQNLQVHHRYYEKGRLAWEYPDDCLICLCDQCHQIVHDNEDCCKAVWLRECYEPWAKNKISLYKRMNFCPTCGKPLRKKQINVEFMDDPSQDLWIEGGAS